MVVGAGRGPIVRAVLRAANRTKVNVLAYALDKNPHAVNSLEYAKRTEWADKPVRVVCADMRFWEPPEGHRADIIVSELLGSFGDNELSPECLDGAQRFLTDGGISIPTSYTSFLAPFQSAKLYGNARDGQASGEHGQLYYGDRSTWGLETAYSVKMQNHLVLAEQKELFTFKHPNPKVSSSGKSAAWSAGEHNNRFQVLSWTLTQECIIHGFAGYFDCVLYGDVIMSIHPKRHSPGLMTWGPILFPLRMPIRVTPKSMPGGGVEARVTLAMWRVCNEQKVWYEWALLEPQITEVHNPGGRSDSMSKIV